MNVQAPFGFATGCHAGDRVLVPATLASMRHYCPQVPICLVVDGNFDVSDLVQDYGVIPLIVPQLPSLEMRQLVSGNYRAKLSALWEGPFEFYVWMDSDAIVWGDFTSQVRLDLDFQIFWKEAERPSTPSDPNAFKNYYFDPQKLRRFDPDFKWEGGNYFSSGAFAARRNAISFQEWLAIEAWGRQEKDLFAWGEMGMLNYLVHAKSQRGELKLDSADLQHITTHHGTDELIQDCLGAGWHFPPKIQRPRVAHFCARKPFMFETSSYSRPFTIARLEHHRRHHGEVGAWLALLNEERKYFTARNYERIKRRLSGFIR